MKLISQNYQYFVQTAYYKFIKQFKFFFKYYWIYLIIIILYNKIISVSKKIIKILNKYSLLNLIFKNNFKFAYVIFIYGIFNSFLQILH